jgi:hypothetical protein
MSAKGLSDMATCESCGCELGRTVKTPIDSSLAFTALLELHPDYGQMSDPEASELHNRFLADWHKSGHTDMFGYAREWVDRDKMREHYELPDPKPAPPYSPADVELSLRALEAHQPSYGPNADGNPYAQYTPEHRVWSVAQEHGRAAANWVFDGNTTMATYRRFLKGIREGDPEVLDSVRTPSLSGEFADEYTEELLLRDVGWVPHDGTDLRDELAEQYSTEVSAAFWHEVERLARDQVEPVTSVPELNDRMEPDHVVRVLNGGRVAEAEGSYAPELVMWTDSDGQALPDSDADLHEQAKSAGWRLLEGWTGQDRYHGPVMHPSEFVGGRLAEHILETPGEYVVTVVTALGEDEESDSDEPAGWAVCFREVPDTSHSPTGRLPAPKGSIQPPPLQA